MPLLMLLIMLTSMISIHHCLLTLMLQVMLVIWIALLLVPMPLVPMLRFVAGDEAAAALAMTPLGGLTCCGHHMPAALSHLLL